MVGCPKPPQTGEAEHRQRLDTGVLDQANQRELHRFQRADWLSWRPRHQMRERVCHGGAEQRPLRLPPHSGKTLR